MRVLWIFAYMTRKHALTRYNLSVFVSATRRSIEKTKKKAKDLKNCKWGKKYYSFPCYICINFLSMLQSFDTQAFQDAGFTFEEIMKIRDSLEEYESTGISYTEKEVWDYI